MEQQVQSALCLDIVGYQASIMQASDEHGQGTPCVNKHHLFLDSVHPMLA